MKITNPPFNLSIMFSSLRHHLILSLFIQNPGCFLLIPNYLILVEIFFSKWPNVDLFSNWEGVVRPRMIVKVPTTSHFALRGKFLSFKKKNFIFRWSLEKSKIKTQLRTFKNPSYFLETRFSTESLISFITIPVLFQYLWYFSWGFLTLVGTFLVHKPFLRTPSKNFRILKLSSRKNHESNVWPNPILLKYHFSK